jgi:hypothetical protein
MAMLRY